MFVFTHFMNSTCPWRLAGGHSDRPQLAAAVSAASRELLQAVMVVSAAEGVGGWCALTSGQQPPTNATGSVSGGMGGGKQ